MVVWAPLFSKWCGLRKRSQLWWACGFCVADPPFKPLGRRNEVWLHLAKTEEEVLGLAQ